MLCLDESTLNFYYLFLLYYYSKLSSKMIILVYMKCDSDNFHNLFFISGEFSYILIIKLEKVPRLQSRHWLPTLK